MQGERIVDSTCNKHNKLLKEPHIPFEAEGEAVSTCCISSAVAGTRPRAADLLAVLAMEFVCKWMRPKGAPTGSLVLQGQACRENSVCSLSMPGLLR